MALTEPTDVTTTDYLTTTLWNTLKSLLFDAIGTQEFTESNYTTNDESVTASLDALDMKLKDVRDEIVSNMIPATEKLLWHKDTAPAGHTIITTVDDKLVFVTKGSAAGGSPGASAHLASFAFDGGSNADALQIGDTIRYTGGGSWSCTLKSIEYSGSAPNQTGRIYYDTLAGGTPADNDPIEDNNSRSFTADVNGANRPAGAWTISGGSASHTHTHNVPAGTLDTLAGTGQAGATNIVVAGDNTLRTDIGSGALGFVKNTTGGRASGPAVGGPSLSFDGNWRPASDCFILCSKDAYTI